MIIRRQGPQSMHMIWQQYLCIDHKGMGSANRGNTGSEHGADISLGQKRLSPKRVDGKEVRTAIHPSATIIGHGGIIRQKQPAEGRAYTEACRACEARRFNPNGWRVIRALLR
jgi:hypothetical protein